MENCIFCQLVQGKMPSHVIWKDGKHLAFLSIFPNTEGFSVVIPKEHYSSYAFDAPEEVYIDLLIAAKTVGRLLDAQLEDVGRTGLILEGFGIDHLHAKLFPMHGTKMPKWKPITSKVDKYFTQYEGYISSHDYHRSSDSELSQLAKRIGKSNIT